MRHLLVLVMVGVVVAAGIAVALVTLWNGGPTPKPRGKWVTAPADQGPGVTHYWDCCKETCSWTSNAPDYGVTQCDSAGIGNPQPADMKPSVCDVSTGHATCQNRYPEIVTNADGSRTLMGFVATGRVLRQDFASDERNDFCGQCYEVEFEDARGIKNAVVQVTNTGDAQGIFDLAVPGGGFGAHNGCAHYSDWKVYVDQGGPCDPTRATCTRSTTGEAQGCAIYGGFQNKAYCSSALGTDKRAQTACTDVLWGVFPPQNHAVGQVCPGYPDNLKVKRYRAVQCPKWHVERTGANAARAPVAKRSKANGATCAYKGQCASDYCSAQTHKCEPTHLPTGATCESKAQCKTHYCAVPSGKTVGTCQKLPPSVVCKTGCSGCAWTSKPHTCENPKACGVDACYTKCCARAQKDCPAYHCS